MLEGARCSSMVEHPLMVCGVVGSIPHGGRIELFLIQTSAPKFVLQQRMWYMLSCLCEGAYKT